MRVLAFISFVFLAAAALAEDDPDAAALALADKTEPKAEQPSDWRVLAEGALIESKPRAGGPATHAQRLSLDAQYDTRLAPQWRAVFADRLDLAWRGAPSYDNVVNTLKEAYLSWQPGSDNIVDAGRVNLRNGVAAAYNPTDYFRAGAVRSVVSVLPASLRENRLGTAMLRGQTLWSSGSASALYAPKMSDQRSTSPFSPDFGATNNQDRWLIVVSQKLAGDISPQWLLYDEERGSPQLGVNLTALLNDATVAHLEWSGGRSRSLIAQALAQPDDTAFRSRLATGLTVTFPNKLSVTAEYQYNGAGLDDDRWDSLRRGPLGAFLQYRGFVQNLQDLPTKENLFFFARWQDVLIARLDISALQRVSLADHSRLSFLETRYHWDRVDLALQWQVNHGDATSEFGVIPQRRIWQTLVTYFF